MSVTSVDTDDDNLTTTLVADMGGLEGLQQAVGQMDALLPTGS